VTLQKAGGAVSPAARGAKAMPDSLVAIRADREGEGGLAIGATAAAGTDKAVSASGIMVHQDAN